MAGGDAGLEDEGLVGLGDAFAVVYDGEGAEAPAAQGGGDKDVRGAGVAGVAQELREGVLDVGDARGAAARALYAGEPGEAGPEVPVRPLQGASFRVLSFGPQAGPYAFCVTSPPR